MYFGTVDGKGSICSSQKILKPEENSSFFQTLVELPTFFLEKLVLD